MLAFQHRAAVHVEMWLRVPEQRPPSAYSTREVTDHSSDVDHGRNNKVSFLFNILFLPNCQKIIEESQLFPLNVTFGSFILEQNLKTP